MKTIKTQYNSEGKIVGYYPSDLEYSSVITPYVELSEQEYSQVLHNEEKYRIQDKKLVCIEDSAEYQKYENEQLLHKTEEKIVMQANLARTYGVITVDNKYILNVNWKEYYSCMLDFTKKLDRNLQLKFYTEDLVGREYQEFSAKDAEVILKRILSAIDKYKNEYVEEKQKEYLSEFLKIKESKKLSGIKNFYNSIDYGCIQKES